MGAHKNKLSSFASSPLGTKIVMEYADQKMVVEGFIASPPVMMRDDLSVNRSQNVHRYGSVDPLTFEITVIVDKYDCKKRTKLGKWIFQLKLKIRNIREKFVRNIKRIHIKNRANPYPGL